MPKIKLNEKAVAGLKAPDRSGKSILHWDSDLTGFAVLCSGKTNSKNYIVQRDIAGKSVRYTIGATNELTFAKAKELAAAKLIEMRAGINPKAKAALAPTLQSWLNRYLEFTELRPGSVRMYRTIERTLKPWMNLQLHEIDGDMVETRHRELAKIISAKKNPRYSGKSTANFAMTALRAIWNFATDRLPGLPANPVRRLKRRMFDEPRRTRYVSAEQLPAFFKAVNELDNPIARDYILLMMFTGLRRTEALTLQWEHVDLKERVIRLPATATKANRPLDLPMSDFVYHLLVTRRRLGNAYYVFPGRSGETHLTANIKAWKMIAKTTGIKVSAHDMRRTFATVAGNTAISPFALKAMLNHSVGTDVTSGYVIAMPELRDAVQKVCDRMKTLCAVPEIARGNVAKLK